MRAPRPKPLTIGWREYVALPEWGIDRIKVKVDTGALTSTLHAMGMEHFEREGRAWIRFDLHPLQRRRLPSSRVEAPILEFREVRSSNGRVERRAVVVTQLALMGQTWSAPITLTRRDRMGFRMLLGRQALRHRFVVDPGRSFLGQRRADP